MLFFSLGCNLILYDLNILQLSYDIFIAAFYELTKIGKNISQLCVSYEIQNIYAYVKATSHMFSASSKISNFEMHSKSQATGNDFRNLLLYFIEVFISS